MKAYRLKVRYYETDMMGVVHHANYIHWMEEARIDFMDQIGFPYERMEAEGVISPVAEISVKYLKPCSFGDEIEVAVGVDSFGAAKLALVYEMRNGRGEAVCTARSEHAFLDRNGRFVRLKKELPAFCEAMQSVVREAQEDQRQ